MEIYYKILFKNDETPIIVNASAREKIKREVAKRSQLIEIGGNDYTCFDIVGIRKIQFELEKNLKELNTRQKEKFFYFIAKYNGQLKEIVVNNMFEESKKY